VARPPGFVSGATPARSARRNLLIAASGTAPRTLIRQRYRVDPAGADRSLSQVRGVFEQVALAHRFARVRRRSLIGPEAVLLLETSA